MSKDVKKSKILLVHFTNHALIGKSLELKSYVQQGEMLADSILTVTDSGNGFLRIDHKVKRPSDTNRDYAEHIPWAQVSKVIFED